MSQTINENLTSRSTSGPIKSAHNTVRTITNWPSDTALYYFNIKLTAKYRE